MNSTYRYSVFINAPFDRRFQRLFDAIVFTIVDCGFTPRCALEVDDGSQARLEKIFEIIEGCRLAVHDISRTQLDAKNRLPRFNMPLELGIFLGAKRFGGALHRAKACIILDTEKYRFQKFISDIAGQDPRSHGNDPALAVRVVRNWLGNEATDEDVVPSAKIIWGRFEAFKQELPALCRMKHWDQRSLTFKEKVDRMTEWAAATPLV